MKKLTTLFLALLIGCSGFGQTVLRSNDTVLRAYDSNTPTNTPYTLSVWLDGDADQTFTLDGTSVDQWDDKSGNDNHVLNGNADATRPTYDINTGRVTFIAANSTFLQSAAFVSPLTQPNTIFIVYKITGPLDVVEIIFDGAGSTEERNSFLTTASNFQIYAGAILTDEATDANNNIHVGLFNGVSSEYWINGVSSVSGNASTYPLDGITLGVNHLVNQYFADCEIMEVIVYDDEVSDTWRDKITAYLADKWSITATTDFKGYVLRQD